MRDSSLRVPPGVQGTVISAKVFSRKGTEKDERAKEIEDQEKEKLLADQRDEVKIVSESYHAAHAQAARRQDHGGAAGRRQGQGPAAQGRRSSTSAMLDEVPPRYWTRAAGRGGERQDRGEARAARRRSCEEDINAIELLYRDKIAKLTKGDELPPGVIKMVKVYVAIKRKLSVGDKMAGRHGNKGVVSRILPEEDMPYLEDGTPVDIVLNPLGVPSRMNIGQILETHLGWAALQLGKQIETYARARTGAATPCATRLKKIFAEEHHQKLFDELDDDDAQARPPRRCARASTWRRRCSTAPTRPTSRRCSRWPRLPSNGQTTLFDGSTGEPFDHDVTVGVMYMLKLHHLVDDKIHARSIGPYSLVTQQPLGGKAQFGGQRLGEMEVWAHGGLRRRLRVCRSS